jgi:hypothetical protein
MLHDEVFEAETVKDTCGQNPQSLYEGWGFFLQAAQKRPSVPRFAGLSSSFPVSSTEQAYCGVTGRKRIYAFPTRDFACLPKPQRRHGRLVPPVAGGIFEQP